MFEAFQVTGVFVFFRFYQRVLKIIFILENISRILLTNEKFGLTWKPLNLFWRSLIKEGQYLKATGICSVLFEISDSRIPRCCGELDHILGNLIIKYPQSQTWYCYFSDVNTHTGGRPWPWIHHITALKAAFPKHHHLLGLLLNNKM